MGLFRTQALEASQHRITGELLLLPRFNHCLLSLILIIWLVLLAWFLTQSQFSRKETVQGFLEPSTGITRVYPDSEGRIARLLVAEGETVMKGQALAIINGDRVLANGQHMESLLLAEYQRQKELLQNQVRRVLVLNDLKRKEVNDSIHGTRASQSWLEKQRSTLNQNLALEQKRLDRFARLRQEGHVTQSEMDQLRRQYLKAEHQVQLVESQLSRQQQILALHEIELAGLETRRSEKNDELMLQLSTLAQEIAQLRGSRAYTIKAPIAGTVSNIQSHAGQLARRQLPVMSLLPDDMELVATLLVPVRAAGFLALGQRVLFRYDAFPYQKFGLQNGQIETVAESSLLPGEQILQPFDVREPVYTVTARPEASTIAAYGERIALKAGMTLKADIELEQRSLLQWLLEPLLSLRGRLG